jgi:hypothetical protein
VPPETARNVSAAAVGSGTSVVGGMPARSAASTRICRRVCAHAAGWVSVTDDRPPPATRRASVATRSRTAAIRSVTASSAPPSSTVRSSMRRFGFGS